MTAEKPFLDIYAIMKYLPHRYPFLLIDRVLECTPGESIRAVKNVTFNEPHFTGHFPDRPVMPGLEPGGADHDRRSRRDGGVEMGLERVGRGEIDQHVTRRRQRLGGGMIAMDEAVAVDAAGDGRARLGGGIADRPAHPSVHAQNADARHVRFMGEPRPCRKRNSMAREGVEPSIREEEA